MDAFLLSAFAPRACGKIGIASQNDVRSYVDCFDTWISRRNFLHRFVKLCVERKGLEPEGINCELLHHCFQSFNHVSQYA